jgi:hypothetical protein
MTKEQAETLLNLYVAAGNARAAVERYEIGSKNNEKANADFVQKDAAFQRLVLSLVK